MPNRIFILLFMFLPLANSLAASEIQQPAFSHDEIAAFADRYCLDCHQGEDAEAGLDLQGFFSIQSAAKQSDAWNHVIQRVHDREMPPMESELPADDERERFVQWAQQTLHRAICDNGKAAGPPLIRRLNRGEYANTIRDLLGIHINAGHALPDDGAGGEGFDNAAETLFISPIHAEKYLNAARTALNHAIKDRRGRRKIFTEIPSESVSPSDAAREILADFLPRAFRRPATEIELARFLELFEVAFEADAAFEPAIQLTLEAVLISPKFLFIWEEPNTMSQPALISDHELASRLSYFLWASMPDERLFELANKGELRNEEVLVAEVKRMLSPGRRDTRLRDFAASFIEQWLGTRALGREFKPDPSIAERYDSELEGGMKYEPIFFFEDLLKENRSLLNFIDSDFSYANRRLARHYGIRGKGRFREQPRRFEFDEGSHRGGLLGMSAVLAVSSYPHRTSPVLRGKWILETMLGTSPPPPPPDVPELEENKPNEEALSLRKRLELHRQDAQCASCHNRMDPLGFGLQNYDVLGQWRTEIDGQEIDSQGELPDGSRFDGPVELKQLLMAKKQQFVRNLTKKMLGYALSRGLTNRDYCTVDEIVEKLTTADYSTHTLILEITKSFPFRYKAGTVSPSEAGTDLPTPK